jgi:hypothetical protein
MSEKQEELSSALESLAASAEKPCGCQENKAVAEDPFAAEQRGTHQLAAELQSALKALSTAEKAAAEFPFDGSSDADRAFLEFGAVDMGLPISLEDIVSAAERYPGLKITFSF